jgi:hypothetical protein
MKQKQLLDLYSDYLLASFGATSRFPFDERFKTVRLNFNALYNLPARSFRDVRELHDEAHTPPKPAFGFLFAEPLSFHLWLHRFGPALTEDKHSLLAV